MSSSNQNTFPVLAEMWAVLEGSLQAQARKLVNDIAAAEKADPKTLWQNVRQQIRVGLVDIDLDLDSEQSPVYCSYPTRATDGAIVQRCRAPCLLGFSSCSKHINSPISTCTPNPKKESVDRVFDYKGHTYFVDSKDIARDKNGKPRGIIKEDTLILFDKS